MNIYAIKDILIDYYLQPFAGENDKEVMAAVAAVVNNQGNMDAIAQSPHHFEIWRIGKVDEEGHLTPDRELVAPVHSLVRGRVREIAPDESRAPQSGETANRLQNTAFSPGGTTDA